MPLLSQLNPVKHFPSSEFEPIDEVVENYRRYYNSLLDPESALSETNLRELFHENAQQEDVMAMDFPNDEALLRNKTEPYQFGKMISINAYHIRLNKLKVSAAIQTDFKILTVDSILYCSKVSGGQWKVYVSKYFHYLHQNKDTSIKTFNILYLSPVVGKLSKYKIDSVTVTSKPKDSDGDRIVNDCGCDKCPRKGAGKRNLTPISPGGCIEKSLLRPHPSTRMGVYLGGGYLRPIFREILEQDITENVIRIKPNYYASDGYSAELGFRYYPSASTFFGFGGMVFSNQIDSKKLSNTINEILIENGRSGTFKFTRTTRTIYTPYFTFGIGNYHKKKDVTSLDLCIGLAIPSQKSKNYSYTFEESTTNDQLITYSYKEFNAQFESNPFLLFGMRLRQEHGFGKENRFRVFFQPSIWAGKTGFKDQNLLAANNLNIKFSGSLILLGQLVLGTYYNILTPKILSEQERYKRIKSHYD